MGRVIIWATMLLLSVFFTADLRGQEHASIDFKPCFIKQIPEKAKCASVPMPLDHRGGVAGDIDVHVAVVPALSSQVQSDPLVLFAGGPGQAVSEMGAFIKIAFKSIREHRDIILIDQRGTGKSTPLRCDSDGEDADYTVVKHIEAVKACRSQYDLAVEQFTMANVIADTHAILKGLGYDQVNLWGVSWGTRSAVHFLRRYPGFVRSVIVDGVLPPDIGIFHTSPMSASRALNKLIDACRQDGFCARAYGDVGEIVDQLVAKATAGDLVYHGADPVTGEPVTQVISHMLLVQNIRAILYAPQKATMLPMALQKLNAGDGRSFMALTADGAMMSKTMYTGATLSILCGEEVPRISAEQARDIGTDHLTKDSYYRYWSTACKAWPSLPGEDDIHTPYVSDVPMVILSGELDPVTPPSMGDHLARSFTNSRHFIVNGVGHNVSYKGCVPKMLGAFLEDADVASLEADCLENMKRPAFVVPPHTRSAGEKE